MPVNVEALFAESAPLMSLRADLEPHYGAIDFLPSGNEDSDSSVEGGVATIHLADDAHPNCCLAHELLHLWLQANGYRRIRNGVSSFDDSHWFRTFMNAIDNELQHHRMFPRFLQMGFNGEHFYSQSDAEVAAHLEDFLDHGEDDIRAVILQYFTVIAPGGTLTPVQKESLRERLHSWKGGKYAVVLQQVYQAFEEWRAADNLNAEPMVRRIMLALQPGTLTWFAYSEPPEFPDNGFFVGQHFVM